MILSFGNSLSVIPGACFIGHLYLGFLNMNTQKRVFLFTSKGEETYLNNWYNFVLFTGLTLYFAYINITRFLLVVSVCIECACVYTTPPNYFYLKATLQCSGSKCNHRHVNLERCNVSRMETHCGCGAAWRPWAIMTTFRLMTLLLVCLLYINKKHE